MALVSTTMIVSRGLTLALGLSLIACGGSKSAAPADADTDTITEQGSGDGGLQTDNSLSVGEIGEGNDLLSEPQNVDPSSLGIDESLERIPMRAEVTDSCSAVFQNIGISWYVANDVTEEPTNLTGISTLSRGLSAHLELVSRDDVAANFTFNEQDISAITASIATQTQFGSVTSFIASFQSDAPETVILRKPVPGGCMFTLRLPGYCASGLSRGSPINLTFQDQGMTMSGCELDNPGNIPVIELPAFIADGQ